MPILYHDYETRSLVDLRKSAVPIYATDPSTDALCLAYAKDDDEPQLWLPGMPVPELLLQAIEEGWELHAWNCSFERAITANVMVRRYGWPVPRMEQYRCTMGKARYNNLPGRLDDCCTRLKVRKEFRKDSEGHQLMLKVSKPNKQGKFNDDPALLQRVYEYCKQDIVAERHLDKLLADPPDSELAAWRLDRTINERGCPIDLPYCEAAYRMVTDLAESANVEIRELTDGYVTSTNCVAKIKELVQKAGVNIGALDKAAVGVALADKSIDPTARRLLELRQLGAPAAVKKYKAALDKTSPDGFVRESLMYYGASATGRWAAGASDSSSIQLQNMYRKVADEATLEAIGAGDLDLLQAMYVNPMQALQMGVRGIVCAPEGYKLISSDLSAVEARIVLWLAGASQGLDIFRRSDAKEGPEPYCVMGSKIYGVPVEEVTKGSVERATGKVACFAADTRVLTDRGPKPLVELLPEDRLWDGVEWVSHQGVVCQGMKQTENLLGVSATADHLILCENWTPVSDLARDESLRSQALEIGSASLPSQGTWWGAAAESGSSAGRKTWRTEGRCEICKPKSAALKPVYDVVNAGPRHRFTVLTNSGPIIVHNCLGLGFGMGATKFQATAAAQAGVQLDMPMCEKAVKVWRRENYKVCALWKSMETAFKQAVAGAKHVQVNPRVSFQCLNKRVSMTLPSGRRLFYHHPKAMRDGIRFLTTKGIVDTWGGHLVENAVQAIARDVIIEAMIDLEKSYNACVLSIHDEIIQCVPEARAAEIAAATHKRMRQAPAWAELLALNSSTVITKRLTK